MTPRQIDLVQDTFRLVLPIGDQTAALFYARLFELDPSLRPLFRGDLQSQGRKLMQALSLAVATLDRLGTLLPILRRLGAQHAGYGVRPHHYAVVGQALLWTLRNALGPAFTEDVAAAWAQVYTLLSDAMRSAADQPA